MVDDPFAVVTPVERKMSAYLKKSKAGSSRQCAETSSKSSITTETTRSTITTSEDSLSFFKTGDASTPLSRSKTSLFNSSDSSGGCETFDFGKDLELDNQGCSPDKMFECSSSTSKKEQKAASSRHLASSIDIFGDSLPRPSQSMRNLNISDGFDPFAVNDPVEELNNKVDASFEAFSIAPGGLEGNSFESDPFGAAQSTGRLLREPPKDTARRERKSPVAIPAAGDHKRSSSQKRRASSRRLLPPEVPPPPRDTGKSPGGISRRKTPGESHVRQTSEANQNHLPQTSHRRRRASMSSGGMDGSTHTEASEILDGENGARRRPPRRGSVTSITTPSATRIPPTRTKSSSGPSHRPGVGGRRQRRASLTTSADLSFLRQEGALSQSKDCQDAVDDEVFIAQSSNDRKENVSLGDFAEHMKAFSNDRRSNSQTNHDECSQSRSRSRKKKERGHEGGRVKSSQENKETKDNTGNRSVESSKNRVPAGKGSS